MRILLWHVHGSWTTSFVQGDHEYVLPVTTGRDSDGLGRARTWDWPPSVVERSPEELRHEHFDVVLLQRPHERELAERWTGRRPGRDVPAIYVEHNTPGGEVPFTRHPMADQAEIPIVHVTHFNRLFWDCGSAETDVVEHGIVDPVTSTPVTGHEPRSSSTTRYVAGVRSAPTCYPDCPRWRRSTCSG
jgi:hypothetical protein